MKPLLLKDLMVNSVAPSVTVYLNGVKILYNAYAIKAVLALEFFKVSM